MSANYITLIPNALQFALAAGGAAGGAFGVIKWFAEFVTKRLDNRAARLDADTRFVIDNLRQDFDRVSTRLDKAETHIVELRDKLIECQEKHGKSEAEVARLSAMLQGYGDARDLIQTKNAVEAIKERAGLHTGE